MDIIFHSAYLVAIAEIGDKTQFLSLFLAARYHRLVPIAFGILLATIANHALAAYGGVLLSGALPEQWLGVFTAILFIAIGLWTLIPDKDDVQLHYKSKSIFLTSFVAFFIAEMGDKTQLATLTLGAAEQSVVLVTIGTTLGMMAANVPALLLGKKLLQKISLKAVHRMASMSFIAFGVWQLISTL